MNASVPAACCLGAAGGADSLWELLIYSAAMVAVLLLLAAGILWFRRSVLGRDRPDGAGGQMEQIEALRRQGRLTEAEYKAARRSALGLSGQPPPGGQTAASGSPAPADAAEDAKP